MSTNSGTVSGAFSERIKQLRKAKGASQAQVAEYLGVTKQAYSLYETGKREPPFATLLKIAEYFGIGIDECIAFGDGGNDISMLRHAGIGVAMGNATDEVKQNADYVTAPIDDDGILYALRQLNIL